MPTTRQKARFEAGIHSQAQALPSKGQITRGAPHVPHRNRPTECQKEHCPGKGELITPELRKKSAHHTEPLMSHSDSNDASAGGKKFLSLLDEHPKGQPAPPSAPPSPPDSEAEDTAEESSPTPQYDPPHRAAVVPTSHIAHNPRTRARRSET